MHVQVHERVVGSDKAALSCTVRTPDRCSVGPRGRRAVCARRRAAKRVPRRSDKDAEAHRAPGRGLASGRVQTPVRWLAARWRRRAAYNRAAPPRALPDGLGDAGGAPGGSTGWTCSRRTPSSGRRWRRSPPPARTGAAGRRAARAGALRPGPRHAPGRQLHQQRPRGRRAGAPVGRGPRALALVRRASPCSSSPLARAVRAARRTAVGLCWPSRPASPGRPTPWRAPPPSARSPSAAGLAGWGWRRRDGTGRLLVVAFGTSAVLLAGVRRCGTAASPRRATL